MFQMYSKLLDIVEKVIIALLVFLLASAFLVILGQVVLRYIVNTGYPWMEEYARYAIVWLALLGSAYALRHGNHMYVNITELKLSPEAFRKLNLFFDIILIAFFIVMAKSGYDYVMISGSTLSVGMPIKMGYLYASVPVGIILMLLATIEKILAYFVARNDDDPKPANSLL